MSAFNKSVVEALGRYEVLSFDVFDTVLLRGNESERRRFWWIARETALQLARKGFLLSAEQLLRSRLDVQSAAYRALDAANPNGDVKLSDIHRLQADLLGLPVEAIPIFLDADMAAERRFVRPNAALADILPLARKAGKRVIAVSDTYYPEAVLRRLLAEILGQTPFDAVYASSDWNATKKSGELFARVLRAENVAPGAVLHWGDDRRADELMAASKGVCANWAPRPSHVRFRRKFDAAVWRAAHWDARWRLA
ncbi:HAD family hydrolase [Rhodoblastus sp.]|uniref:HAD family hydrolase n=1 Tax=Rhodoblastus sp. TaxID=1962975 RepID=UPI003F9DFA19